MIVRRVLRTCRSQLFSQLVATSLRWALLILLLNNHHIIVLIVLWRLLCRIFLSFIDWLNTVLNGLWRWTNLWMSAVKNWSWGFEQILWILIYHLLRRVLLLHNLLLVLLLWSQTQIDNLMWCFARITLLTSRSLKVNCSVWAIISQTMIQL